SEINDGRPGLTYIPFARDGVTFWSLTASNVPDNLTEDELDAIYQANGVPGSDDCFGFRPLVPASPSAIRDFWEARHGPFGTCVRDTDPNCVSAGNPTGRIQENDGCWTGPAGGNNANTKLFPSGVASWIAQATNSGVHDQRVFAILR